MSHMTFEQAMQIALGHHQAGRLQEAEVLYRRILAANPRHPEALQNLGALASHVGRNDVAVDLIRQAIAITPDNADLHYNLGLILQKLWQLGAAEASFRRALELRPNYASAQFDLANVLVDEGQYESAVEGYQRALGLKPGWADAHINLGVALQKVGRMDEAIAAYRAALAIDPGLLGALGNLGNALNSVGRMDDAVACFTEALRLDPQWVVAHDNLLGALLFHPATDQRGLFQEIQRWNRIHALPLKGAISPHANDRTPGRPLRIGYVSPDLRRHPVGRFLLPLLASHDKAAFHVTCYALPHRADEVTARLKSHADAWRDVIGLSDEQFAKMIRDDRIDILVDLAMHMAGHRLLVFARKPAPVQVTYLAYAGGTGVDAIDYRLTDRHLDPDEAEDALYMEKSVRLAGTYWCYQASAEAPAANELPARAAGFVTFGCLNNFSKVSQVAMEAWATLLLRIAGSRLLLYAPDGEHRSRVRQFFRDRGIGEERVELVGHVPMERYFATYHRMDIALDPFPCAGGTTTCDALWMGVPVVTLAGRIAAARAGVSILCNVGLPGLVAQTVEQYVEIAAKLAGNVEKLAAMRAQMRGRMEGSPLMDAAGYARAVEGAYRGMWEKWCGG